MRRMRVFSGMPSVRVPARRIATFVSLLALSSVDAVAQSSPDSSARANAGAARGAVIELAPATPRQGSIVRITIRGVGDAAAKAPVITPADTASPDSLPTVTVILRPRLDSLRAVLDTLAPRRDTAGSSGDPVAARGDSALRIAFPLDTAARLDTLAVHATLFGEPLHFRRENSGAYVAIGGIPVDAPASVRLAIVLTHAGGDVDTTVVPLAIRRTAYKMEKLSVAPKFGQAPDSALAARIAREQALAAMVSRRSHESPRLWDGDFQRPRDARVTSAFGDGRQFNGAIQSRHMGLDLAGAVGAPVLATNRGVVALVGEFYYAGNAVYIDHGAGLVTAYFHLSAVDVAQGDTVTPGVRIGRVGATGRVTGPHLHWVARYGSVSLDPSTLLELNADGGPASPLPGPPVIPRPAVPPANSQTPTAPVILKSPPPHLDGQLSDAWSSVR